jgi:hypothetical protein
MTSRLGIPMLFVVAGCSPSPATPATEMPPDAGIDAPPPCVAPDLEAAWLRSLVSRAVGDLASTPRGLPGERERARAYLEGELRAMGWEPKRHTYETGENVHATIPATASTPGALVVVGAHFDSVPNSPGANDNASGVAVVLAVAEALKQTSCRAAPVSIVFFDEEELGLFGSTAFAQTLSDVDVRAVHTIDQVAWDANGDRRFELELPTKTLEEEWKTAAALLGATLSVTKTDGSDHQPFRALGIPAVGLTEGYVSRDSSPYRHTIQDTAASIEPHLDYLVLATKLTARVVLDEIAPTEPPGP